MTASACPVCATPYEAGAATCAFCGVSLVEPEPKPAAKTKAKAKPPAPPAAEPEIRAEESPPPAAAEVEEAVTTSVDEPEPIPAETAEIPADSPPSAPEAASAQAPSFARDRAAASAALRRAQRIEWGVVAGLVLLLAVQVVASDFDQLAANSATRSWLQPACAFLRCTLPPWREPRALHLLQRDVRANPQRPGLLRISASFRNEARWTQSWPRLRVTLSDADGRAIAARDFEAGEYLGTKPTTNGIASGQVASVAVDVVDPSPRVTAFTFEFE